jgi:hypothetical protein
VPASVTAQKATATESSFTMGTIRASKMILMDELGAEMDVGVVIQKLVDQIQKLVTIVQNNKIPSST